MQTAAQRPTLHDFSPVWRNGAPTDYTKGGWTNINYTGKPNELFRYRFDVSETEIVIVAEHDFEPGGPAHTASIKFTKTDECQFTQGDLVVENELE